MAISKQALALVKNKEKELINKKNLSIKIMKQI